MKFIGQENGDLIHECGRVGVWEDCDLHDDDCYVITCGKCGEYERDCDRYKDIPSPELIEGWANSEENKQAKELLRPFMKVNE